METQRGTDGKGGGQIYEWTALIRLLAQVGTRRRRNQEQLLGVFVVFLVILLKKLWNAARRRGGGWMD